MMTLVERLCRNNVISEDDRIVIQGPSHASTLACEILGILSGRQNVHRPASDYGSPQFTALITVTPIEFKLRRCREGDG